MSLEIRISNWEHVSRARRAAVKLGGELGFNEQRLGEIAIIVSELADNLISHEAQSGVIQISIVEDFDRKGIQILSADKGPGISNIESALKDGYSEKSSLGIGLGAIKRLSDEFDIYSHIEIKQFDFMISSKHEPGTVVISRLWKEPQSSYRKKYDQLKYAVISRPKPGLHHNGDSYYINKKNGQILLAVIDGLGHGEDAEKAAIIAKAEVGENKEKSLTEILKIVHKKLHRTRGAVASLLRIDEPNGKIYYAGIGNVKIHILLNSGDTIKPVNYNGILGNNMRTIKEFTFNWDKEGVIVMHSDGISEKFVIDFGEEIMLKHPMIIADLIMRDYSRSNDDATVVVLRKWGS